MKDDVYYISYPMLRNCINKQHTRKTRLDRICLGDSVLELGREL